MKKRGLAKRIVSVILTAIAVMSATFFFACKKSNKLQFWVYGDEEELRSFTLMTNEFNETYGKEHGIEVEISAKPVGGNYTNLIQTTASSSSGADIFFVIENDFKKWVEMGFMQDLTDYFAAVDDIDISDIPDNMLLKYRYDTETEQTKDDSPLYGLPLETRPTALYYNESVFEKAGIIVISVDESDMDAWNAGEIADRRGKYKSDFPSLADITVPKKGYFRENPCYRKSDSDFNFWVKPEDEILVFNNRIAMNWDEVEDLGRIFSVSTNPRAEKDYGTEYGYYTEWWFNYGWSVGGDCLADLNGNGYWNFSLLDASPNYMVKENDYVGEFSDTVYKKGETLSLTDKLAVSKGQLLSPDDNGGYTLGGAPVGVRDSVKNNDNLIELPSMRTAFERYTRLGTNGNVLIGDAYGLQLAPTPSIFSASGRTPINYFYSGKLAILAEQSSFVKTVAKETKFKWDVAPLAVFKEYENPSDPYDDTVERIGKVAGHSNSRGLVTRKKSTKKDEIARFIMWMASAQGQRIRAENGLFPNQESLIDDIKFGSNAPQNVIAFSEGMKHQKAGDWWYLKAYSWIDVWSVPLNSKLRNNTPNYTYQDWIDEVFVETNQILYDDYIRDVNKG